MIRITTLLFLAMALAVDVQPVVAQTSASIQSTPVQRIRANPMPFVDREVAIVGKIIRYVDTGDLETSSYYIEDDFGVQLRVVTRDPLPSVDSRWTVNGIIAVDPRQDPYLVEARRVEEVDQTAVPADPVMPPPEVEEAGTSPWSPYLPIGLGGALLLGFFAWLVVRRPGGTPAQVPSPVAAGVGGPSGPSASTPPEAGPGWGASPSGNDFYDGKTVRFHRPSTQDGTLKLLPGRLEVLTGPDRGNEVRFVHSGAANPEITFGRSEGPKFQHIQLTAPTVSRRHALIRFDAGDWSIANFSETNPVVVNGSPLLAIGNAKALEEGDTIEFGEVSFKFHGR